MADARLGAQADEAVTDGTPSRRLGAVAADALTTHASTPSRRLGAIANDTLTTAATVPQRRLAAASVEVLVPARLSFVGWGSPINAPSWV